MKLRNHQFSTPPRIFDGGYEHPWYKHASKSPVMEWKEPLKLNKPNPPTEEAVKRAQFKDKTFHWNRSSDIRPRS